MLRQFQSPDKASRAFTLIELLVVISILLVLGGLMLPLIVHGQTARDNAVNAGIMHTVDKALDMYDSRNGFGLTPTWKESDPNNQWGNHLFFKLSKDMDVTQRTDFKTAVTDSATDRRTRYPIELADPYRGDYTWGQWSKGDALDKGINLPSWKQSNRYRYYNNMLNELRKRDLSLLKADHYSSGIINLNDIGKEFIGSWTDSTGATQESVLDVFGNPIIYAYKFDPGIPEIRYCKIGWVNKDRGFKGKPDPATLDGDGLIDNDTVYIDIVPGGRRIITDKNGDSDLNDDWEASDIRNSAVNGFELDRELWSAGPDGLFDAIRGNHAVNEDNYTIQADSYK